METQGQRIRRMRDDKGIKQKFISETTGITQAHLSRIENDESGVTKHTLRKIAAALGVEFDALYVPKAEEIAAMGGAATSIESILTDDAAMIRFMGGDRPDEATMQWVRRSLGVIRDEIRRRRL